MKVEFWYYKNGRRESEIEEVDNETSDEELEEYAMDVYYNNAEIDFGYKILEDN